MINIFFFIFFINFLTTSSPRISSSRSRSPQTNSLSSEPEFLSVFFQAEKVGEIKFEKNLSIKDVLKFLEKNDYDLKNITIHITREPIEDELETSVMFQGNPKEIYLCYSSSGINLHSFSKPSSRYSPEEVFIKYSKDLPPNKNETKTVLYLNKNEIYVNIFFPPI